MRCARPPLSSACPSACTPPPPPAPPPPPPRQLHHTTGSCFTACITAAAQDPDPEAEDRKGCSGHVGKMIYSAGVSQLALVAYVPDPEHNKSASKIDVQVWMDHVLSTVGGGKVLTKKTKANSPKGGYVVVACIPADADKGKFPLKDKDASMAAAFDYLRKHDAFPEDNDDSDEMVFGDDDNLDDYE